jgi:hypothetical protein
MLSFSHWLAALTVALSLSLVAAGTAGAETPEGSGATASKSKRNKTGVKILTVGQKALLSRGVRIRVKGRPRSRVRVNTIAGTFDDGNSRLAASKAVRLGRKGRRVVRLRLVPTARRAAGSCSALKLIAKASSGRGKARSTRNMVRQKSACQLARVDLSQKDDCDFIAQPKEGMCMMPFPNDYFTRSAATDPPRGLATGKRIHFTSGGTPQNASGVPISPDPYNASDGFSQGQGIILKVPGLDTPEALAQNDFVGLEKLGRYSEENQRAVVIDSETGKRWPIWVQIDSNATSPEDTALMINPAMNYDSGHRYVVALRNLTDENGKRLEAPNAFRYYRDARPSRQSPVNQRSGHFEGIFKTLRKAKIRRSNLYLAWDFTVASDENLYRRALYMRDEAFKTLGDTTMADNVAQGTAPVFTVNQVTDTDGPQIKRTIRGTYTVPCFLTRGCLPGGIMDLDENDLPQRNGNYEARFTCTIPQIGLSGATPPKLRPYIFGHGLVGNADAVRGSINPNLIQEHAMIACGTDESGMASEDVGNIALALTELSTFNVVPDRLQQGLINELFLARLMYHPGGLGTVPAFQDGDGTTAGESVIRNDHVYYMGASQGAIMGGPLTAISPDFTQSALVVGAMNYSTLLNRSTDWPAYGQFMNQAYPDELARPLIFNIIQMLWDRGEPNGYAHRMTDNPPPNTPPHKVSLHVAVGDHQVTNFASDVEARTVGLHAHRGGIDDRRWPDYDELWNVPRIQPDDYPFTGSSVVYWDGGPFRKNPSNLTQNIGTGTPPIPNLAPTSLWEDPHGAPRGAPGPVAMIGTFFDPDGYIDDYCSDAPCLGGGWDGDFDNIIPVPVDP